MPFCSNCGSDLPQNAKFCFECGAPVQQKSDSLERREQTWEGKVHKCPNCGEILKSFSTICPSCGFELRGVESLSKVNELSKKLESAITEKQCEDLIRNFPIPNTKEDIYEFLILATSNIEAGGAGISAWHAKLDQTYQKAQLVFGEGPELDRIEALCGKTRKTYKTKSVFSAVEKSRLLQSGILFLIGTLMTTFGGDSMLAILGLYPIIGAFLWLMAPLLNKKK